MELLWNKYTIAIFGPSVTGCLDCSLVPTLLKAETDVEKVKTDFENGRKAFEIPIWSKIPSAKVFSGGSLCHYCVPGICQMLIRLTEIT